MEQIIKSSRVKIGDNNYLRYMVAIEEENNIYCDPIGF